jgi:hypothetical protein
VLKTQTLAPLRQFRKELYDDLDLRQDSLFELIDAVLCADQPTTLVRLSLSPAFRRRWPSTCDALADGSLDSAALRRLFVRSLPKEASKQREIWALDGTVWPRPAAATSPERTWEYRPVAGRPQKHLVPAWEYQWLVALPQPGRSWVLPLDVRRRGPSVGTPTHLAIEQLRAALSERPADAPRPVVVLDSHYAPCEFAAAQLAADVLVRLPVRRRVYRATGPYVGRGAPRKHGPALALHQPATHGTPDLLLTTHLPAYGRVSVQVWLQVHDRVLPHATFTLVGITVEHLPRQDRQPKPLWLAWIGGPLPTDLLDLLRWYQCRFLVEHGFRFVKHALGWSTIRPRRPAAADRWSWLISAAVWQLWLARPLLADTRMPWERSLADHYVTPGRIRRGFNRLLITLGTPARVARARGKSPGRLLGTRRGPQLRFAVLTRSPQHVQGCRCIHHRRRTAVA